MSGEDPVTCDSYNIQTTGCMVICTLPPYHEGAHESHSGRNGLIGSWPNRDDRIRALHKPGIAVPTFCTGCGDAYPCATVRALDGETP